MKTYQVNGKVYAEDEVIAIHRMWQDIQDRENISESIELALAMIGDDEISEYVRSRKPKILEQCVNALPEWGVLQDECLSQNCLLDHYLIADKLKKIYAYHKERDSSRGESMCFSKSGITSWGYLWVWIFGSPIELKTPDGHTVLVTDFHTLEPEYNFEDDWRDFSYSMSPAQDTEWGNICWNCYQIEFNLYGMVQKSFKSCVNQLIQDYKAKNPDATYVPSLEFSEMLGTCLNVVRKQWHWDRKGLEWLFNYDGPINGVVEKWLTEALERQGF